MSQRVDRFFAWVWRINALAILALALSCLVLVAAIALEPWSMDRESPDERLMQVAGTDLGDDELRLSDFTPLAGSTLLYATLARQNDSFGSGSYSHDRTSRNVLFFDTQTKKAHWLFPDNEQEIPSLAFLKQPPCASGMERTGDAIEKGQRVVAILAEVAPLARDGDAPTRERDIVLVSPDGRATKTLVESSQGFLGNHQVGESTVFLFYVAEGAARVLDLDLASGEVRSDAALSTE